MKDANYKKCRFGTARFLEFTVCLAEVDLCHTRSHHASSITHHLHLHHVGSPDISCDTAQEREHHTTNQTTVILDRQISCLDVSCLRLIQGMQPSDNSHRKDNKWNTSRDTSWKKGTCQQSWYEQPYEYPSPPAPGSGSSPTTIR